MESTNALDSNKTLQQAKGFRMKKFDANSQFKANYFEMRMKKVLKRRNRKVNKTSNDKCVLSPSCDLIKNYSYEGILSKRETSSAVNDQVKDGAINSFCFTFESFLNGVPYQNPDVVITHENATGHQDPWNGILPLKPVRISTEEILYLLLFATRTRPLCYQQ